MDPEDLTEDWKKLKLSKAEEKTQIVFDPQLDSLISYQMELCLVRKLLSSKTITPRIIKNSFANA